MLPLLPIDAIPLPALTIPSGAVEPTVPRPAAAPAAAAAARMLAAADDPPGEGPPPALLVVLGLAPIIAAPA